MEDLSYQVQGRLEMLKERSKRCVCKYCGGQLNLRRIIFSDFEEARIEIFCNNCDRIEFGCEKEIYRNAKYFVDELHFNCFPDLQKNEQTRKMNIAKVCEIMQWGDKNLGLLDNHGFTVPIQQNAKICGEDIILDDDDLKE